MVEGKRGLAKLRTWEHLLLGGFSGACAATATMPLDFAKTTIQCGSSQPVVQVLNNALRQHGPAGLFRGMVSRHCLLCIADACHFTVKTVKVTDYVILHITSRHFSLCMTGACHLTVQASRHSCKSEILHLAVNNQC